MTELIAEIGINHNGSTKIAMQLIDIAAASGCSWVKFQKRNIDLVYTKNELDAPRESPWGKTFRDQKQGLEFSMSQYMELSGYIRWKENLKGWFASPWDLDSIKFLNNLGSAFIKVPSALITDFEYLEACKQTDKDIIISTGMSTIDMIDKAVDVIGKDRIYCIMHCTSTYPSKPEELNLKCIPTFKERYPFTKIGFSNHNPGIIYIPIAIALGAEMIEYHITLDRAMYGSDQAASIEPEGAYKIGKYSKGVDVAMGDGVKVIYESEKPIIAKLRRV
jgi:N-acetylneuraminate synthase